MKEEKWHDFCLDTIYLKIELGYGYFNQKELLLKL